MVAFDTAPHSIAFEDFILDEACFELRRLGVPLKLEPKTFDLLQYLIRHRDRVVTKRELLDRLWPEQSVSDAVVHTHIALARRALNDDRRGRLIQTLHSRGYRFVGRVRPQNIFRTSSDDPQEALRT